MTRRRGCTLEKGPKNSEIRQISAEQSAYVARLYQRYHKTLLRFLQRMELNPVDALDIAQEAFYRIARKENLISIEQPRAFLFRTAVNLVADLNRQNSRRHANQHVDIDNLELHEPVNTAQAPERVVQGRQRISALRAALRELKPSCADTFILFKFEGLSQAETARQMGISISMVEKHVVKALTHLRKRLATDPQSRVVRLADSMHAIRGKSHDDGGRE